MDSVKGAFVVVQDKGRSCTSMCPRHLCIHARCAIARYSKELQRRHVPPQACHSCCSVTHLVGDHNHRSYFLQNQKPVIRMERSTDFFRFNIAPPISCVANTPLSYVALSMPNNLHIDSET
ncbi:MAG: hypothetical protein P8179_17515 [Candidatus Thiodiazotropha sp.]